MRINPIYKYGTTPLAREDSIVKGDKYRFTVLTSRLIRIEYNENGHFEDRATQTVINRCFDHVDFKVEKDLKFLKIITDDICLTYLYDMPFDANTLQVKYIGKNSSVLANGFKAVWSFGDKNSKEHRGTTQTLDGVNGECELGDGIMSCGSINVLDDSKSLFLADDGWVDPADENRIDQYLFCYGIVPENKGWYFESAYDYLGCLKAYYQLTGKQPLIPRYLLGNWWSRFHAYSQQEYVELVKRFKSEGIPFSVAVIDMDWHNTKIGSRYGSGWTGYSWNKELFPDHKKFLGFLHNEGYEPTLNLHPAEGIAAHEDAYPEMAEAMGIDPDTEVKVEFDITDPKFLENYFSILHHPMEDEGVSFWWMDWQQGNTSYVKGIEPLWMLNHYHHLDNKRNGKRPVVFSRYAGPGSHRYPIGFSGDTVATWQSLDFQPYFTASASNIGYGWWSHDIGGHMGGKYDDELTARWVQLGVFSPINRLHSSANVFTGKEPWRYGDEAYKSIKKFLKLRHELIPYTYTMNYRSHFMDEPIVQPLYYKYSGVEPRKFKNEYMFGTELVVAPITRPHDNNTDMGSTEVYLPKGIWYDFFSGQRYSGDRIFTAYRRLDMMPVFAKAGGIIPLANLKDANDTANPENLKIKIFAGESGRLDLYEDDGVSEGYQAGEYAITTLEYINCTKPEFIIHKTTGDTSWVPEKRSYELEFYGISECKNIDVYVNGVQYKADVDWKNNILSVMIYDALGEVRIVVKDNVYLPKNNTEDILFDKLSRVREDNNLKEKIFKFMKNPEISRARKLAEIWSYNVSDDTKKMLLEIISADVV